MVNKPDGDGGGDDNNRAADNDGVVNGDFCARTVDAGCKSISSNSEGVSKGEGAGVRVLAMGMSRLW